MYSILKNNLKKVFTIFFLLLSFSLLGLFNASYADAPTPTTACQNTTCIINSLSLDKTYTHGVLIPQSPVNLIIIVIQVLLMIIILVAVYTIVRAGMTIAGAREDAEVRASGGKSILNAVLGLGITFLALGITFVVKNTFDSKLNTNILKTCTQLDKDLREHPTDYDFNQVKQIQDACDKYIRLTDTPSPTYQPSYGPDQNPVLKNVR